MNSTTDNISDPSDPYKTLKKEAAVQAAFFAMEARERERKDRLDVATERMREYCTRSDIGDPERRSKLADELLKLAEVLLDLAGVLKALTLADRPVRAMQQSLSGQIAVNIMRDALAGDREAVTAKLKRVAGFRGGDQVNIANCLQDVGWWYWSEIITTSYKARCEDIRSGRNLTWD